MFNDEDIEVQRAIDEAKKRLRDAKPGIEKRHQEGIANSTDEPDILKSGCKGGLRSKRVEKEQKDDIK